MIRKGQVLTIGIVVIGLSLFLVFTYLTTIRETSVLLSDQSSAMLLEDFINSAEDRNAWLNQAWYSADKEYRKQFSLFYTLPPPNPPVASVIVGVNFPSCPSGDCMSFINVTDLSNSLVPFTISGPGTSGTVTITQTFNNLQTRFYYFYYNDSGVQLSIVSPNFVLTSAGEEAPLNRTCEQFDYFYNSHGLKTGFDCSYGPKGGAGNPELNYTVSFLTSDLEFEGQVS